MKILTVVGARPQFVKAAVVSRALEQHFPKAKQVLVHTGQHYDDNMSKVFFNELGIANPDFNLGIGGGSHGRNTGRMIEGIEALLFDEKPDFVLVYGDTDSTLAGAIAASKLSIRLIHVEAGLRSYNRNMAEEVNRVLTDHVSDILFAPTTTSLNNLINEGIEEAKIIVVGDVMYDASLFYKEKSYKPVLPAGIKLEDDSFVLSTIHRPENTDDPNRLKGIFEGLGNSNQTIVFPLHPRTNKQIKRFDITIPENVVVIDPVGYLEMLWLESRCRLIVTDSGGVQKEAYFNKKPCITVRNETEWNELVDIGCNVLVEAQADIISNAILSTNYCFGEHELYGKGKAGSKIALYLSIIV